MQPIMDVWNEYHDAYIGPDWLLEYCAVGSLPKLNKGIDLKSVQDSNGEIAPLFRLRYSSTRISP